MSKYNKFEMHNFMCIKCGNSVYSLPRQTSHKHKQGHLKKLYCPHCKIEVNCYECKDDAEVYDFRIKFENNDFIEYLPKIEHC